MDAIAHEDKIFEKINYAGKDVRNREFERCTFKECDLSESVFAQCRFEECEFIACNLSMINFHNTSLRDIKFRDCKLLGVNFSVCEDFLFSVDFKNCILDYAVFARKKMLKTKFVSTSLKQVDFSGVNLSNALFDDTDLADAVFNGTVLKEANFVSAYNYSIDPEINSIKKAKFSLQGVVGLLTKYGIRIE